MLPGIKEHSAFDAEYGDYVDSGLSNDMAVNGSVTPVRFAYAFTRANGQRLRVLYMRMCIVGGRLDDPLAFGGLASPLTNGLEVGFYTSATDIPLNTSPYKSNIDIIHGTDMSKPWGFEGVVNDALIADIASNFDIEVDPHQILGVYATVHDDLSGLVAMRMSFRGQYT